MYKIKTNWSLMIIFGICILNASCALICNCTNEDIYKTSYDLQTGEGRLSEIKFPELEMLNINKSENKIIVNDTCMTYFPDYILYDHFIYIYDCKFGRLDMISSSSEQWPRSYINSNTGGN